MTCRTYSICGFLPPSFLPNLPLSCILSLLPSLTHSKAPSFKHFITSSFPHSLPKKLSPSFSLCQVFFYFYLATLPPSRTHSFPTPLLLAVFSISPSPTPSLQNLLLPDVSPLPYIHSLLPFSFKNLLLPYFPPPRHLPFSLTHSFLPSPLEKGRRHQIIGRYIFHHFSIFSSIMSLTTVKIKASSLPCPSPPPYPPSF